MCHKYFSSLGISVQSLIYISIALCLVSTGLSVFMSFLKFYLPRHSCCELVLGMLKYMRLYDYMYIIPIALFVLIACIVGLIGLRLINHYIIGLYALAMFAAFLVMIIFILTWYFWDDDIDFRNDIMNTQNNAWSNTITGAVVLKGWGASGGIYWSDLELVMHYYECCGRHSFEESFPYWDARRNSTGIKAPRFCCAYGLEHSSCRERFSYPEGCLAKVDDAYMELFTGIRVVYLITAFLMLNASLWGILYFLIYFFKGRQKIIVPILVVERISVDPTTSSAPPQIETAPETSKKGWIW